MAARAIDPRSSPMKVTRWHQVTDGVALCKLPARNGWREVPARVVDCPKCLAVIARRQRLAAVDLVRIHTLVGGQS